MEETNKSVQEFQRNVSNYYITLLSGEIIDIPCLKNEDITETRGDMVVICLESASYDDRLYQAFKNKELIQYIRRECKHIAISDYTEVEREFTYNHYFKITDFNTVIDDSNTTYNITFETV